MNRKIKGHKLIIASHNQGKVSEIKDLLSHYEVDVCSSEDFGMEEPEENGDSFEENALIKASETAKFCGQISLSDDSGLCVDDLDGGPGIFSARWAGPKKDFLKASKTIEKKLLEVGSTNYSAYFVCVLAVCWPDGENRIFRGTIDGSLIFPARGELGFGYDPIFIPRNYDITFGDISIVDECVHYGIDKRKYLVTHGDHYDKTMEYPWLSYFGDRAYNYAIWVSRQLNRLRRLLKLPYWSFSGMLKQKAKGYLEYLYEFESQVARQAQIRNFDGVICGHTHTAKIVEINDMIYMNDGDWVESLTALVETYDGEFRLEKYYKD